MSISRLVGAALLTMSLAFGTSACGGSDGSDEPARPATSGDKGAAGDDMIVKPLEAVGATKVEIGPDEVRAHFAGSVDDAAAWTYCTGIKALIGPKAAIVVYSDGELACADRNAG